ncbi:MAG: oligosaccharide flippase family protein [Bacteroidales bacterium]|nr:oligosaccharide flippase family protein [Candidatus Cacconaster equi]
MANPLKQLASETAIYGLSTILARIVNFMLVPLYTRVLMDSQYGVVTEMMSYIAVLQVVLVLGLETGCFRYASKEGVNKRVVFSDAFFTVLALCLLFFGGVTMFSNGIASGLGYAGHANVIIYTAAILLLDCPLAVIFAKLRHEHKALRFAIIKTLKILTEVGMNLLLYLVMPAVFASNPDHWLLTFVSATPDYTYAIFAIFVSCVVSLVLLIPDLFTLTLKLDTVLWKKLMLYSLPLMVAGLPGVMNDFLDRILMRFLNADPATWRADLGVYQAGVKIAVIMQLFSQMFRYAAEPFFFQRERDKDSKQTYVTVLNYFVAFCMFGFVVIMLFIDEIGLILGKDFRAGLSITPIMLMAYIGTGVLFNVNMWYKLAEKTGYAVWVTLAGLVVSVIIDVSWMPVYSYHAAAWGHLASYLTMIVLTVLLGRKYYRIPYDWPLILAFVGLGLLIWWVSTLLPEMGTALKICVHLLLVLLYVAAVFAIFVMKKHRYESKNCQ